MSAASPACLRAGDAFFLDRIRRHAAHACRIDERERHAADVDALGQQIARRPRNVGHDGARRAGEPVEQARLADIGTAHDRDRQPFADDAPATRIRQQRVERVKHLVERARRVGRA